MASTKSFFDQALEKNSEIGYVEQVFPSLVYASGLPGSHPSELLLFETGEVGQVLSMNSKYVEILLFTPAYMKVGTKIARTNEFISVQTGEGMLGTVVDPLGRPFSFSKRPTKPLDSRYLDVIPSGIKDRSAVVKSFETGVSIVDLVIPLGKGQRELIIGDRKTGKSAFLLQALFNQASQGTICIYSLVGKRQADILHVYKYVHEKGIGKQTVILASAAADSPGLIFLTPYSAMTMAENFRDQGRDVLVVMDDLTTHASVYREIALLARRFPGRNSYPGDIFYIHSRLLERAGSFKKGTITALVGAETTLGDLSGYIQTNLMAITDGHLFFDTEFFNQGIRPAVNPYLSVTRVGEQAQSNLVRDLGRQLSRFLSHYQRLKDLTHFGSEFEQRVKDDLALGEQLFDFFSQPADQVVPLTVSIIAFSLIWNGSWKRLEGKDLDNAIQKCIQRYRSEESFKNSLDAIISQCTTLDDLLKATDMHKVQLGLI